MRTALLATVTFGLAACSGGFDQPPKLASPIPDQYVVQWHDLDFDVTQGGRSFTAADGVLSYEIRLGPGNKGVRAEGTRVVGNPEALDPIKVEVRAFDSSGKSARDEFTIFVSINGAPRATRPHADVLVKVGAPVSIDVKPGVDQFLDPEGDPLRYEVSLRGAHGIEVSDMQLSGRLHAVGAVEVTVTATDKYGASGADVFLIAAPAPEGGAPSLPPRSHSYTAADVPAGYRDRAVTFDTERSANPTTDTGATLGRVLFHDTRLSITNTVACASCHRQARGFAGAGKFDVGVIGVPLRRQTMPLANNRFNRAHAWFSDLRAPSLKEVARTAMQLPEEMGMNAPLLEAKLRATRFYPPLFEAAFGSREITEERVLAALEQYLQSMVSWRTRLDRAFEAKDGNSPTPHQVLDAREMRGLEIFTGAAGIKCNACHDLATGSNRQWANNGIDASPQDPGTTEARLRSGSVVGIFRAAALRNLTFTAPYMHDGRFATLREVIDHYDHGIRDSVYLDSRLRAADGKPLRMNLSEADKQALEAFLRTFDDESMLTDPRFSDPFSARRAMASKPFHGGRVALRTAPADRVLLPLEHE